MPLGRAGDKGNTRGTKATLTLADGERSLHEFEKPRQGPAMAARGFTVIELVIVLAIAALVLAMTMPMVNSYVERGKVSQAVSDLAEMSKTIRSYEKTHGALPESLGDVTFNGSTTDPWGYAYQYFNLRTAHGNGQARQDKILRPLNSDFDLYSIGPDGLTLPSLAKPESRDDIVRARDGAFVGPASEFDPM
jgi:general secretion pathway protein G